MDKFPCGYSWKSSSKAIPMIMRQSCVGLAKLRDRRYHREPLSKSIGSGLFELRHVGKLNTSQQNISRLESPSYAGHSLSMLRRVADVLGASVRVTIESQTAPAAKAVVAEPSGGYRASRPSS